MHGDGDHSERIGERSTKTLIVYYSFEGNTRCAARLLAEKLGAETLELEPVRDYPRSSVGKYVFGGAAASFSAEPELKPYAFEPDQYDLIVLGSPVWAGRTAPPMNTFLKRWDLRGRRVAAFACSSGGRAEKMLSGIAERTGGLAAAVSLIDPASHPAEAEQALARFAQELRHE